MEVPVLEANRFLETSCYFYISLLAQDLPTPCFKLCGTGFHAGHARTARSPQVEFGMAFLGLMATSYLRHLSSYSALLFVPSALRIPFLLLLPSSLFGLFSFPWGFRSAPLSICHLPTLSAINTSGRFNLTRLAWRCSGRFIILYESHYVTGNTMCPGSANSAAAAPSAAGDTRRSPLATQDQTSLHSSDAKVPLGTLAGVRRGVLLVVASKDYEGVQGYIGSGSRIVARRYLAIHWEMRSTVQTSSHKIFLHCREQTSSRPSECSEAPSRPSTVNTLALPQTLQP